MSERNPFWQLWYPTINPNWQQIPLENSAYGQVNEETLAPFDSLAKGSTVVDVGGGEGRYAIPLAQRGMRVVVLDVDESHMSRLRERVRAFVGGDEGSVEALLHDVTQDFPNLGKVDGVITAGLAHLMPPDELDNLFGRMTGSMCDGGILSIEFATNRKRLDSDGKSLIGPNEYQYSSETGLQTLSFLFQKHGLSQKGVVQKTIHFEVPYYMHTDILIAQGIKGGGRRISPGGRR